VNPLARIRTGWMPGGLDAPMLRMLWPPGRSDFERGRQGLEIRTGCVRRPSCLQLISEAADHMRWDASALPLRDALRGVPTGTQEPSSTPLSPSHHGEGRRAVGSD
jgi:hypothetical protein